MNEVGSKSFDLDVTSTVLCKIELTEQDFSVKSIFDKLPWVLEIKLMSAKIIDLVFNTSIFGSFLSAILLRRKAISH